MRRGHQPGAPTFVNVIVPPRVTVEGANGYAPSASPDPDSPAPPPGSLVVSPAFAPTLLLPGRRQVRFDRRCPRTAQRLLPSPRSPRNRKPPPKAARPRGHPPQAVRGHAA